MAIIRGAFGGGQIKGSISGNTYQQGPFGTVIRNRTVPVNPSTLRQNSVRTTLGILSNAWATALSATNRQDWEDYAAATPIPDKFGGTQIVKGRQMFMRANLLHVNITGGAVLAPPTTPGQAPPPTLSLTASEADGIEVVNNPGGGSTGDLCSILVGVAVNQSRNYYKTPFRFSAATTPTTTFPFTLPTPAAVVIGQRWFIMARNLNGDGKVSEAVYSRVDVLT